MMLHMDLHALEAWKDQQQLALNVDTFDDNPDGTTNFAIRTKDNRVVFCTGAAEDEGDIDQAMRFLGRALGFMVASYTTDWKAY